jgi:hypothetical protein
VVTVGAVIFVGLAAGEVVVAGGGVTSEPTVHVSTYQPQHVLKTSLTSSE